MIFLEMKYDMGLYDFSYKVADEKEVARAQAFDIDASYKDLSNVFAAIKGKSIPDAKKTLEDCISMKKAIQYRKFSKHLGHRKELHGRKGRYPKKEARIALILLKSAEANANFKGLEVNSLVVRQAAAYKQSVIRRMRHHFGSSITLGYGKQALYADYSTCRAEIVLAKGSGNTIRMKIREEKAARRKEKRKGKGNVEGKKEILKAEKKEGNEKVEEKKSEKNDSQKQQGKEEIKNKEGKESVNGKKQQELKEGNKRKKEAVKDGKKENSNQRILSEKNIDETQKKSEKVEEIKR